MKDEYQDKNHQRWLNGFQRGHEDGWKDCSRLLNIMLEKIDKLEALQQRADSNETYKLREEIHKQIFEVRQKYTLY